ncbi:MAG: hypothetical protein K0S40_3212 [Actinomycetospora sp.]|nr:hypothetical protein [Actinomycetospora sp.]
MWMPASMPTHTAALGLRPLSITPRDPRSSEGQYPPAADTAALAVRAHPGG